ncbi:MAG: M48 family metalloprotease [Elusimicrobia bacterium]|nr:M48 family metalloprotease [Elusimicrobiota bacterium]
MRLTAAFLLLCAALLPSRASDEWEDRKRMNLRANMHNAFMQEYTRGGKSVLEPAPGWLKTTGAKLAAKAGIGLNRSWRFYAAADPAPNILATPYGTLIVHQGLLDLGLSKDETAAIMAHEMAHAAQDHAVTVFVARMAKEQLGEFSESQHGEKSGQIARLKELVADLRYGLGQEKEADELAAGMLKEAGLPPAALVSALKKLGAKARGTAYLRSHPGLALRIGAAQRVAEALEAGRAKAKLPTAKGRPEIGRPTYMRRAMDQGYDYKKPMGKKER